MKQYRIGDYAKYLGVTPDFLKHYEDMGIIESIRSEKGYRYYPFHTTLFLIESIRLRNYGLTLREIQEVLSAHSVDDAKMEQLFDEKMELLRQERLLDEALANDYDAFQNWRESLNSRGWDWEIRRSKPMCFLPHTDGYDFLRDERIYDILNQWMSYIPIVKSAMKVERDGKKFWGFLVSEQEAEMLKLPFNDVVEHYPSYRMLYYKFHSALTSTKDEYASNPDHPAFRFMRSLNLTGCGAYFRVTLMPGNWKETLNYQYGYYAIPLEEIDTITNTVPRRSET